jgi:hypothetical protein
MSGYFYEVELVGKVKFRSKHFNDKPTMRQAADLEKLNFKHGYKVKYYYKGDDVNGVIWV